MANQTSARTHSTRAVSIEWKLTDQNQAGTDDTVPTGLPEDAADKNPDE